MHEKHNKLKSTTHSEDPIALLEILQGKLGIHQGKLGIHQGTVIRIHQRRCTDMLSSLKVMLSHLRIHQADIRIFWHGQMDKLHNLLDYSGSNGRYGEEEVGETMKNESFHENCV